MSIERIPVTDRKQWLALREKDVTASVAGALLGVHEFVTPFSLWALKSGKTAEDPEETGPMRRGRLLEPVAVQLIEESHPDWTLQHGGVYLRDPKHRLGATPDLRVMHPDRGKGVIQIKSVEQSVFRRKWKDENGELSPPIWIAVQGILEAHLEGAEWAAVAPLVVGFGIDCPIIDIPIHQGVIDMLKEKTAEFWRMVDDGTPPPVDFALDGEALAQVYSAGNGEILDLTADNRLPVLCEEDAQLAEQEKEIGDKRTEIRNEIKAKIGEAKGATCLGWSITLVDVKESTYTATRKAHRQVRKKRIAQEQAA